jgi:predicted  nucleic acid-binding Zn-ribbon protein
MKLQFDVKTILIVVFLGLFLTFASLWYFMGSPSQRKEIKKLKQEYEKVEAEKKQNQAEILRWKSTYDSLVKLDITLSKAVIELEKQLDDAIKNANYSKGELDKIKNKINETRKKIEDLKKNPINRENEDLLNSLKNKTKI